MPVAELISEAEKFAKKLTQLPAFALRMAKNSINYGFDLPLDNAVKLELGCVAQCFNTQDQKEGMKAFLEKRKPNFIGR